MSPSTIASNHFNIIDLTQYKDFSYWMFSLVTGDLLFSLAQCDCHSQNRIFEVTESFQRERSRNVVDE